MGEKELDAYIRGQWKAFDRVLNVINTIHLDGAKTPDDGRRRAYNAVMSMFPEPENSS